MKRAEAIGAIEHELCKEVFETSLEPDGKSWDTWSVALRILQVLEASGMQPPIIEEKSFKMLPSGEMTYAVHEWEKE